MEIIKADTDYATRVLVSLAQNSGQGPIGAKRLAREQGIPEDFAYKILQRLGKAGFVRSRMGSRGGFELAQAPDQISLLNVLEAIQGPVTVRRCVLGVNTCARRGACPVAAQLVKLQDNMTAFLSNMTVAEIAGERN